MNTKIVCTLGPASQELLTIERMIQSGMRVARLNFSHGSYENHAMLIKNIRTVSKKLKTKVLLMQDLQGPKIRVQNLEKPLVYKTGEQVIIGKDFNLDFDISSSVKVNQTILIEDGIIELKINKIQGKLVYCTALTPAIVQSHKGVNLPGTKLDIPSLTEKDIKDLEFGLTQNLDLVAISFVRKATDVKLLRQLITKYLPAKTKIPEVVVKIEKPEGVKNFNNILKATDWVMVARGDLGVELPASHVPVIEKTIVHKCRLSHKPVIVATQMLNSMISSPRPTRAEVSDVANAVMEGANYVMLSGESAFGKYPVESVKQMQEIINVVERSPYVKKYKL